MNFIDLLKFSTRMFKARTSRTILTILGMSIGIAAILFLVSMGYGMQKLLLERITTSDSLLSLDVSSAQKDVIKINEELINKITTFDGIEKISPVSQINAQLQYNQLVSDAQSLLVNPYYLQLEGVKVAKGATLNDENIHSVVITSAFAKIFKEEASHLLEKEINLTVFIPVEKKDAEKDSNTSFTQTEEDTLAFKIPHSFKISGYIEGDEPLVYVNLKAIKKEVALPYYSRLKIKCKDDVYLEPTKTKLTELGLTVSSLSETVEQANQVFKVIQIILALFGVIALVVSAIGMFNTMTVTLLERTEEIGIMKSIGVSERDILMMFVMESSVMGFLGGVTGVLLGFIGGKSFNLALNLLAQKLGGEAVNIFYSPLWFMGLILFLATTVGFFTGLIPARKASSLDPLDALRYK